MYRKSILIVALGTAFLTAGDQSNAEREVHQLIDQWDAAYRSLDAKALTSLETPDFELINRLGQWTPTSGGDENERMWAWAFKNVYRGKPGPRHRVEQVRFLVAEVAIVTASASWPAFKLGDGTPIPAHGEIVTFVVVKRAEGWRIAAQNIHNQMPGDELPAQLPWNAKQP